MREVCGNLWNFHNQGNWVVVTTNGNVKGNGEAVMGRGVALQAKIRFPDIPRTLGFQIGRYGLCVTDVGHKVLVFPTKFNWWEKSSLGLIEKSSEELLSFIDVHPGIYSALVYLPRPGCSNGGLDWGAVKPVLEKYLDDRFVVVSLDSR